MNKKSILMVSLCVGIAVMAIAYAAFSTTLQINTTVTSAGGLDIKLSCSCATGTAGLTGATKPTATCTPTSPTNTTAGIMTASLRQPGDSVSCTYTIKNDSLFNVKTTDDINCGSLSSPFTSSVTALPEDTVITAGSSKTFTITMGYLSSITSQPSTTTGSITCTVPISQVG